MDCVHTWLHSTPWMTWSITTRGQDSAIGVYGRCLLAVGSWLYSLQRLGCARLQPSSLAVGYTQCSRLAVNDVSFLWARAANDTQTPGVVVRSPAGGSTVELTGVTPQAVPTHCALLARSWPAFVRSAKLLLLPGQVRRKALVWLRVGGKGAEGHF